LNKPEVVDVALKLVDACWNTYASTATGIGPEAFAFISNDGNYTGSAITAAQQAFYDKHGFYINSGAPYYILRPEVLESNFYAWRTTGDVKYLSRAASAVQSFNKYLKTKTGYAGLENVDDVSKGQIDDTESFWFAEVLKYL
jgi:mannosyl-oligosaccharide alpha-1,2-mannosidase